MSRNAAYPAREISGRASVQDAVRMREYEEMMRHYIPVAPRALIMDAWRHNATPMEVLRHIDRVKYKLKETHDKRKGIKDAQITERVGVMGA